jgi:hypothetical protein
MDDPALETELERHGLGIEKTVWKRRDRISDEVGIVGERRNWNRDALLLDSIDARGTDL